MRKFVFLLASVFMTGLIFFTSCSKDETVTGDQKPSLTLQVGADYISANTSVTVSSPIKIGIRAMSNGTSNAKLASFTMSRTFGGSTQTYDSTFSSSTFNVDLNTEANKSVGDETFLFTVRDKDGQSNTLTIIITTTSSAGEINVFSMKIMGAQANANGSSFASIDGTVYKLADAKANAAKVDLLYYYGATDFATIAAPNDVHAGEVYNNATNGLQTWSKLNATKFKLITDVVNFDGITNDQVIVEQCASGVTETRITNLTVGKLLAFITESGKDGILKIDAITGTNDGGTVTISVKVQQ